MKRCYAMRKALALLDFDSESISDVKRLLLRAAFLPAFLRTSEGRKLPGLPLHPGGKQSLASSYFTRVFPTGIALVASRGYQDAERASRMHRMCILSHG